MAKAGKRAVRINMAQPPKVLGELPVRWRLAAPPSLFAPALAKRDIGGKIRRCRLQNGHSHKRSGVTNRHLGRRSDLQGSPARGSNFLGPAACPTDFRPA